MRRICAFGKLDEAPGWKTLPRGAAYFAGKAEKCEFNIYGLPEVCGFSWPDASASSVRRSFDVHSRIRVASRQKAEPPTPEEREWLIALYHSRHRIRYPLPAYDLDSPQGREAFDQAVHSLNFSSGPGLGAFARYPTIAEVLGWDGFTITNLDNYETLRQLVKAKLYSLRTSNLADDIRVFIKDEPHTDKKVADGRLRLIMVLSLEDQLVDRILFSTWSDVEQQNVMGIPGKTGWTPLPFGYKLFDQAFPEEVLATDCSSFDWTVPSWAVRLLLECSLEMVNRGDATYRTLVTNRWAQVLGPFAVVRLPDGERYQQDDYGLMKSGWLRTIAGNSDLQFLIHALAWRRSHSTSFPTVWTMGDDVIMSWDSSYDKERFEAAMATTGAIVKHGMHAREFAGFRFQKDTVDPLYTDKHMYMLRYVSPDQETEVADSYTLMYALASESVRDPLSSVFGSSLIAAPLARAWARGGSYALRM